MRIITLLILSFVYVLSYCSTTMTIRNGNGTESAGSTTYNVDTIYHYKCGPGSQYTQLRLIAPSRRLDVYFLTVDISSPEVTMKTVLARDSILGGATTSAMAISKHKSGNVVIGGTNGDFFVTSGDVGLPVGSCVVDGQSATPPSSSRQIFAIDDLENLYWSQGGSTSSTVTLQNNVSFNISRVNHNRGTDQLILYNDLNGKFTRTNSFGTEVLVELKENNSWGINKDLVAVVKKIEKNIGNMPIDKGQAVLSGHGTAATFLEQLAVGDEVKLNVGLTVAGNSTASFRYTIGGDARPLMIDNGVAAVGDAVWNEMHPRTGLGGDKEGKKIIQCVVDGRGVSAGATTIMLADLMISAGAYNAVNLDGGGSSCLYLTASGVMNVPSDGTERADANGIYAVAEVPFDDNITEIATYKSYVDLPPLAAYMPKILGYNKYGVLVNNDLQGSVLSCEPDMGEILPDGRFLASGTKGGKLTITNGIATTTVDVRLSSDGVTKLRLDSIVLDKREDYHIEAIYKTATEEIAVYADRIGWIVEDENICNVVDGRVIAKNNGRTRIYCEYPGLTDNLIVKVQNTEKESISFEQFDDPSLWKFTVLSLGGTVLSTDNRPANWTYGGVINFTVTASMVPFVTISRQKNQSLDLYGRPDSLFLTFNTGTLGLNKIAFTIKSNGASYKKEFTSISNDGDQTIKIAFDELLPNTKDYAAYPIVFESIRFDLNTSTIVRNNPYFIAIKDITLKYNGVVVSGITEPTTSKLVVYPNPVNSDNAVVYLQLPDKGAAHVEVVDVNGRMVRSSKVTKRQTADYPLSLAGLNKGVYIIKVSQKDEINTAKLFFQ